MKRIRSLILLSLMLQFQFIESLFAQSVVDADNWKGVVGCGVSLSISGQPWGFLRAGLVSGRSTILAGVQRHLPLTISRTVPIGSDSLAYWPVAGHFSYMYRIGKASARLSPFLFARISVSGMSVRTSSSGVQTVRGTWLNVEPGVGYGFRWIFWELFALSFEAGVGLDVQRYYPRGVGAYPASWPAGWLGLATIERRF